MYFKSHIQLPEMSDKTSFENVNQSIIKIQDKYLHDDVINLLFSYTMSDIIVYLFITH